MHSPLGERSGYSWLEVMDLWPPPQALFSGPKGSDTTKSQQSYATASELGNCELTQLSHFPDEDVETQRAKAVCPSHPVAYNMNSSKLESRLTCLMMPHYGLLILLWSSRILRVTKPLYKSCFSLMVYLFAIFYME